MKKYLIGFLFVAYFLSSSAQTLDTVFVQSGDLKLHTVYSAPAKESGSLAILIAGSGGVDLNGNSAMMTNNSLKLLSDELLKKGMATVRFDKRGVGKSLYANYNEANLRITHFAEDVEQLIRYYKKKTSKKIYLIGHSQGSLLALLAAQNEAIDGYISVAGAGNPVDVILKKQFSTKLPAPLYAQAEQILDSLKLGHTVTAIPIHLQQIFRPYIQPYMSSWMKYQPVELIQNLKCKSLIIQGGKDIQVDLEEAQLLSGACENAELLVVDKMNHILKTIEGDVPENVAAYNKPSLPVNEDLVNKIAAFISLN